MDNDKKQTIEKLELIQKRLISAYVDNTFEKEFSEICKDIGIVLLELGYKPNYSEGELKIIGEISEGLYKLSDN